MTANRERAVSDELAQLLKAWRESTAFNYQSQEAVNLAVFLDNHPDMLSRLAALSPPPDRDVTQDMATIMSEPCSVCSGDCASANPPVAGCPVQARYNVKRALSRLAAENARLEKALAEADMAHWCLRNEQGIIADVDAARNAACERHAARKGSPT